MKLDESKCIGCGICMADCFSRAIRLGPGRVILPDGPCMGCFHCLAICPVGAISGTETEMAQVVPSRTDSVPAERLLELIRSRRSIRRFTPEQLTEEELGALIDAARYSPTAGNRQPLRYLVLQDTLPEITKRAILALGQAAEQPQQLTPVFGGHEAYAAYWKRGLRDYQSGKDGMFYGAPTVLLLIGPPEAAVDAGIASSNTELLAASMGLGACYVAFFKRACVAEPALRETLGLEPGEEPLAILALGHPNVRYYRTVPRNQANITRR